MAKYRHRIFEMYEFRDETIRALTPKTERTGMEVTAPESWTFKHLAVSLAASMTHVKFKEAENYGEETETDLRDDFSQLAHRIARDSRVLLDFAGVESICPAFIDVLVQFNLELRTKGSRMALCSLRPAVREYFFVTRSP